MNAIVQFMHLDTFLDDADDIAAIIEQDRDILTLIAAMNNRRDFVPRIQNYAELTIPQYNLDDFKLNFRISRHVFERVLQHISPYLLSNHGGGTEHVNPEKMTLVCCWFMANNASIRLTSNTFGASTSTIHTIIYKVLDVFQNHLKQVSTCI